jgi:hypothetical protein
MNRGDTAGEGVEGFVVAPGIDEDTTTAAAEAAAAAAAPSKVQREVFAAQIVC